MEDGQRPWHISTDHFLCCNRRGHRRRGGYSVDQFVGGGGSTTTTIGGVGHFSARPSTNAALESTAAPR